MTGISLRAKISTLKFNTAISTNKSVGVNNSMMGFKLKSSWSIIVLIVIIINTTGCNSKNAIHYTWDIEKLNIIEAWKLSKGNNQIIAFIDTGISSNCYQQYIKRIIAPKNVLDNSENVVDQAGHGTEMITAATGSGFDGIWGIAPEAQIMPIVAIGKDGYTSEEALTKGVNWAIKNGATIINLSVGSRTHEDNENLTKVIKLALKKNIIVVAAAGDYGESELVFPASVPGVISVEAQAENGQLLPQSNHSIKASIAAPGNKIPVLSIDSNGHTISSLSSGTSVSTSIVSGLIALALSKKPYLTPERLVKVLRDSIVENKFMDSNKLLTIISENDN